LNTACEPLSVAILKSGLIWLNPAAYVALHRPVAVELLFDVQARTVGLRSVGPSGDTAHLVRVAGTGAAPSYLITATAFIRHYKIDVSVSRRWSAHLDDDVVHVDLRDAAETVSKTNGNRDPGEAE
jgi:hypothetical protein